MSLQPAGGPGDPGASTAAPVAPHEAAAPASVDRAAESDQDDFDEADDVAVSAAAKRPRRADKTDDTEGGGGKRHYFSKELRCMMYGLGDSRTPYTESVELLETLVVDYIRQMTVKCMQLGKPGKVALEDIYYLTRRDARKYARVKDLLSMNEELRRARKAFDEAKY